MTGAAATQGVLITAIVVVGGIIITALISRKSGEPAVMKAKAEIEQERWEFNGADRHRQRMQQLEYDRAQENFMRDKQRNQLEHTRELRALGLPSDDTIKDKEKP